MSTGTTMVESSFDVQPAAIATSTTTNLININISNSGNITAVASGENHQINKCYNAISSNAPLRLQSTAQPRTPQYSALPLTNTNHCVDIQQQQQQQQQLQQQQAQPHQQQQQQQLQQRSPIAANINQIEVFNPDLNTISTIATATPESNMDALSCNYKNCSVSNSLTKPKVRNDVVFQTPQHNSSRAKKNVVDTGLAMLRNQPNNVPILPPPLFDEPTPSMSTATLPLLQPTDSIRQLKSRRHHRTIPRHFTLNDAANNNTNTATAANTLNSSAKVKDGLNNKAVLSCPSTGTGTLNSTLKKSVCQCPVQHVPMTYMGSAYLNLSRNQPQQTQEMLMSTLTRTKWPSQKSHVAKSASFTSTPSMAQSSPTAHVPGYNRNSASGLLSATNPNGTLTSTETQTNSLVQPKTPSKISTISKQIGHNDLSIQHSQVQQQCNDSNDAKSMQELLPININNNEKLNAMTQSNGMKFATATECEAMPLGSNVVNPVLPPKLSKTPISKSTAIATANISAPALSPNVLSMSSSLNHGHQRMSARERSKSPAADKTYSMVTPLNFGPDQKVNHIKTTYPTTANLTIASNHFTLPKPLNAAKSPMSIKSQSHALSYGSAAGSTSTLTNKVHSSSTKAKRISMSKDIAAKPIEMQSNESQCSTNQIDAHRLRSKIDATEKSLPVCTTFTNCSNPKEHFLPNDTSLDDDYLSECENCKSAHGSRYTVNYMNEEQLEPQETMTLQRKMDEKECDEQTYYRTSSTLPTNTKQKTA